MAKKTDNKSLRLDNSDPGISHVIKLDVNMYTWYRGRISNLNGRAKVKQIRDEKYFPVLNNSLLRDAVKSICRFHLHR